MKQNNIETLEKIYNKLPKKELIKLLIIKAEENNNVNYPPAYFPKAIECKSWDDCKNPYKDCLNCPLRFKNNSNSFTTNTPFSFYSDNKNASNFKEK